MLALGLRVGRVRSNWDSGSVNIMIRCKTDMVLKAADMRKRGILLRTLFDAIIRGSRMMSGGDDSMGFSIKYCFMTTWYWVGLITSRHVTKIMVVTPFDASWPKIRRYTQTVFRRTGVIAD